MFFNIDKKFEQLGFEKVDECKYLIQYEKKENY